MKRPIARPTRRESLKLGLGAVGALSLPFTTAGGVFAGGGDGLVSAPADTAPRHGLSVFGALKYPPEFRHFGYVNPNAPKGGRIVMTAPSWQTNQNPQTFNSLNMWVLRGDSPPRLELIYDSLMTRALDEPDAVYGLVAESVEVDEAAKVYTFNLRPEARFHDGAPITSADVVFSLTTLKEKGHPLLRQPLQRLAGVEADGDHRVVLRFAPDASNRLPPVVASLPVLPKHFYDTHDFEASTLTVPLGSGPYKVGSFRAGAYIEYQRVDEYWGNGLAVARGHNNFDVIRLDFFRDRQITFQAFTKGDITLHEEFVAKTWATEYNFPAIQQGQVVKAEFPDDRPAGAQGWFMNLRREKFADPRTRQALGLAFDFEWSNDNLFYGLYQRTDSFFQNSDLMAAGEPTPAELALLEPWRGQVPDAAFGPAVTAPVSDGSGQDRKLLGEANRLLREAGWTRRGPTLVGPDGKPFTVEILSNSASFERVVQPFAKNLRLLGIEATFRLVDPAQYEQRLDTFDFDMTGRRYSMSPTPGESIREFWSIESATLDGSNNLAGIALPGVDPAGPAIEALTETLIQAPTREDMVVAARTLDRVLRAGYYWVPNWYKGIHTVAFWDMFGYPDKPRYDFPVEGTWWYDPAKAAAIGRG